jgi:hypothetical protein
MSLNLRIYDDIIAEKSLIEKMSPRMRFWIALMWEDRIRNNYYRIEDDYSDLPEYMQPINGYWC